jgi:predicted enzyme related to lactoylglutathione lyase
MNRIHHLEIHADDAERAVTFYRRVFDWIIQPKASDETYWLVYPGEGYPPAGVGIRKRVAQSVNIVPQIQVDSIDAVAAKVVACGGKALHPRKTLPGAGTLLYCQDCEGNLFALMEKA